MPSYAHEVLWLVRSWTPRAHALRWESKPSKLFAVRYQDKVTIIQVFIIFPTLYWNTSALGIKSIRTNTRKVRTNTRKDNNLSCYTYLLTYLFTPLSPLPAITETISSMASAPRSVTSRFTLSEHWFLMAATIFICGFLGYVVYDAVMATASELLQRLLVISPLLLVIAVHWLSSGSQLNIPIPGSEPGAIHRAGGSPWGVAFLLIILFFLISYQPSLNGLIF